MRSEVPKGDPIPENVCCKCITGTFRFDCDYNVPIYRIFAYFRASFSTSENHEETRLLGETFDWFEIRKT